MPLLRNKQKRVKLVILLICLAPFPKIFPFSPDPNRFYIPRRSRTTLGAYRDRHERGAGFGGRGSAKARDGMAEDRRL
jgi:hypothetical protein